DAVMMVESEAKELSEEVMLGAVMFGQEGFQPVIEMIISLAEDCAKEPWELEVEDHSEFYGQIKSALEADLRSAYAEPQKTTRQNKVGEVKAKA
ncbi:MAG: polyribonucleotide nucleotidyltransferase, partial [Geminicoccales bacterium]